MKHIVTITLNPAIDKSTSIPELVPEKKLKCAHPKFEPGGGGINVSRVLQRLNNNSIAIYFEGGFSGKFFSQLVNDENIETIPIEIKTNTRENFIVFDQKTNIQYRFGMPGPEVNKNETDQLLNVLERIEEIDYLVLSGSMPSNFDENVVSQIALICKNKNAKFIIDTSGPALKNHLKENVFLIKPNINELATLAGLDSISIDEVSTIGRNIIASEKCEAICVSLGAKGAMLITKDSVNIITPPKVNTISTVGAGDSMLAGIVHKLSIGEDLPNAVKFGVSCGTAATLNPGTELCHLADVENILQQVSISPETI
jgi:6-phosphofructokinase 2